MGIDAVAIEDAVILREEADCLDGRLGILGASRAARLRRITERLEAETEQPAKTQVPEDKAEQPDLPDVSEMSWWLSDRGYGVEFNSSRAAFCPNTFWFAPNVIPPEVLPATSCIRDRLSRSCQHPDWATAVRKTYEALKAAEDQAKGGE